ncbi:pyridoxamine 5'-phosphate oxidase family protein [Candidatus Gottesmanbacteria bacterium]|nr:pyridoxamine 5'-phosphate oxidase family protein [Candidatus Gottesmanbacteria bacterium]
MNLNGKTLLFKFLQSQNLMTLATLGEHLWVSNVYFVCNEKFNLYFLSEPKSQHCLDIKSKPQVACAIADTRQKVVDKKIGVQLYGISSQVKNLSTIMWMLKMWNKLNPGFESIINLKNIQSNKINGRIYKIEPTLIKFFNEELYGPEGFKLFNFGTK